MTVLLVNDALALESMRASDFDAYSAYGEVIDNSIQAGATRVDVKVFYSPKSGNQAEPINKIAFSDDGSGMEEDVLHRCLQLGYSSRYNDRNGIGRFGVGMTLAAINQCKRVDVYSRTGVGSWLWTYIDLEEIKSTASDEITAGIAPPKAVTLPPDLNELAPKAHGTIVVWSKYDARPETRVQTLLAEMKIWFGRTFRHFIWPKEVSKWGRDLRISVNGEVVAAIDPLYVTTTKTKFSDDPPATEYKAMELPWPVASDDRPANGAETSTIRIRFSLLPEALRAKQGAGGTAEARERCIDRNEGISFLRNGREVAYGHVPFWKPPFEEIDRWWGCEVQFDAVLDKAFKVKNVKRGAVPVTELKEAIREKIAPSRKTAVEKVRELWSKAAAEQQVGTNVGDSKIDTGHGQAEAIAGKTGTAKSQIDAGKKLDDEAQQLAKAVAKDQDEQVQTRWAELFKSQPFTIVDSTWKGPTFFDPHFLGGVAVLDYNLQHPFFVEMLQLQQAIQAGEDVQANAARLKVLIDLLIISFAKAESMFEVTHNYTSEQFVELLRNNWGQFLQSYVWTWQKERK